MSAYFGEKEISGWGGVKRAVTQVARPERMSELTAALAENETNNKSLLAVGNLRSYGDVCVNSTGDMIFMNRLNRFIDFDPETGIFTAEAGATLAQILHYVLKRGYVPPVSPGTGFCTLGGALANDVHGKNHETAGCFSKHVLSFKLMTADGEIRTVTRESDFPLFCATAGGIGLTGIILEVTLQLKKVPGAGMKVTRRRIKNLGDFLTALDDNKEEYSVGWIDASSNGDRAAELGRGILETGTHTNLATPIFRPEKSAEFPFHLPTFALNRHTVRLFNELYFRRIAKDGENSVEEYRKFVYPLDKILNWNRMYGKSGFYQFQCVVPAEKAEAAFAEILTDCAKYGNASFLAVIKKTGDISEGMMSFPKPGFTVALDFPSRGMRGSGFINRYETVCNKHDGRIYLAKDHMMRPDTLAAGYPRLAEFQAELARIDPRGRFKADLPKRTGIIPYGAEPTRREEA